MELLINPSISRLELIDKCYDFAKEFEYNPVYKNYMDLHFLMNKQYRLETITVKEVLDYITKNC
jgi:hypothetical protein